MIRRTWQKIPRKIVKPRLSAHDSEMIQNSNFWALPLHKRSILRQRESFKTMWHDTQRRNILRSDFSLDLASFARHCTTESFTFAFSECAGTRKRAHYSIIRSIFAFKHVPCRSNDDVPSMKDLRLNSKVQFPYQSAWPARYMRNDFFLLRFQLESRAFLVATQIKIQ